MENPKELVLVLLKIQRGQSFFKENFDFKKADIFLRRFENLRDLALEKINLKTLKVIREANSENNLSVVVKGIFDKATKLEDVELSTMIYQKPRNVSQSNDFETVKMLISALEEKANLGSSGDFQPFCDKIYEEYFDHRLYLMEQYLDCVARIIESMGVNNIFPYLVKYLEKFTYMISLET